MIRRLSDGTASWLVRWRPVLPLMGAELILWLGFAAFLPVLPLYVTDHGVDVPTLGIVIAAWPAARLIAEPLFGLLADRTARKPLMVIGLLASAVLAAGPLFVSGVVPFVLLRAAAGLAAGLYDPAARGYLVDATPADRHGEAFGLYSAAQMGGFLFGPALGALLAAATGRAESVFLLGAVSVFVAAIVVAVAVRERPHVGRAGAVPADGVTELPYSSGGGAGASTKTAPASLWNRILIAAIILNFGAFYAGGTWEVIWSLFMSLKGGSIEFIGFTFVLFAIPVLVVSPYVGRLVDRRGSLPFLVLGSAGAIVTGFIYTVVDDLLVLAVIVIFEAISWALVSPALYAVVATGSPAGRSSTAQGVFGAAGTVAYILSSVASGHLFATDYRYPFYVLSAVVFVTLLIALAIAGRARLEVADRDARPPERATPPAPA